MSARRRLPRALIWTALPLCLWSIVMVRVSAAIDTGQDRFFRYLMGTAVRVEVYGGDPDLRREAAKEAFAAIAEVDRVMSDYRTDSELTLLNQTAAFQSVHVSDPLTAVMTAADRVSRESQGAFDATIRPALVLWGVKDRHPRTPSGEELAAIRPVIGYRNVELDSVAHAVHFVRPGVAVDLGGLAKGFAAELAASSLRKRGLSGIVDDGGAQYVVGQPPGKRIWSVGLAHPDRPGGLLGAVDVSKGAVATASDPSSRNHDATSQGLVLDPRTLQPSHTSLSATVISPDGTLANALSRAVFVLGPDQGLALLARFPDTWGVVAFRGPHGDVVVRVSPGRTAAYHPVINP